MMSGLYCADVRAGLRNRARRVGESWVEFARAEDRAAERVRWAAEANREAEDAAEDADGSKKMRGRGRARRKWARRPRSVVRRSL